jgi:hypothetical protein
VLVGVPLGILVGVVSGAAFVILLRNAFFGDAKKAVGSLLAMPTSWFGGGWLTEAFDLDQILSAYVASLAISVVVIGAYPLFQVVARIGRELGSAG